MEMGTCACSLLTAFKLQDPSCGASLLPCGSCFALTHLDTAVHYWSAAQPTQPGMQCSTLRPTTLSFWSTL
eukprot:4143503-Amphidinium_carterae.1